MNKQQTIRSHTVPQMYLKNFTNEKNQVWVYSLKDNKCFKQNIRNVCVENKSYEFKKDEIDNILEDLLSKYESLWAPLLLNIINGQNIFSKKDIKMLLYFCIIQHFRTKQGRKKLLIAFQNDKEYSKFKNKFIANINTENAIFFKAIKSIKKLIKKHIVIEIKIYQTIREIYISDTPVLISPLFSYIYCPLTPNSYIVLVLVPKTKLLQYQKKKVAQKIFIKDTSFNKNSILLFASQNCNYIIKKSEFTKEELDFLKNLIIIPLS